MVTLQWISFLYNEELYQHCQLTLLLALLNLIYKAPFKTSYKVLTLRKPWVGGGT